MIEPRIKNSKVGKKQESEVDKRLREASERRKKLEEDKRRKLEDKLGDEYIPREGKIVKNNIEKAKIANNKFQQKIERSKIRSKDELSKAKKSSDVSKKWKLTNQQEAENRLKELKNLYLGKVMPKKTNNHFQEKERIKKETEEINNAVKEKPNENYNPGKYRQKLPLSEEKKRQPEENTKEVKKEVEKAVLVVDKLMQSNPKRSFTKFKRILPIKAKREKIVILNKEKIEKAADNVQLNTNLAIENISWIPVLKISENSSSSLKSLLNDISAGVPSSSEKTALSNSKVILNKVPENKQKNTRRKIMISNLKKLPPEFFS